MLCQLSIENIALIDKLSLELKDGLNILSGETGAGKSIIIDSLNFVLGERADKSLIRYGTDKASVEAVFEEYITPAVSSYLDDLGIETEDVLVIRRKMSIDGKNECRINGRISTLSTLKGLTELLVDIHGQHEHQSLLKSVNHISLLDKLGEKNIEKLKTEVESDFRDYSSLKKEFARFGNSDERERKLDILTFQIDEIEKVDVKDGEEDELLTARKRIRNMEKSSGASGNQDSGDPCLFIEIPRTFQKWSDGLLFPADHPLHEGITDHKVGGRGILVKEKDFTSCLHTFHDTGSL